MQDSEAGKREQLKRLLLGMAAVKPRRLALSAEQRRLFWMHQLRPDQPEIYITIKLDLAGPLDLHSFQRALEFLVHRHGVLRARFKMDEHGEPFQEFAPPGPVTMALEDLSALEPGPQTAELDALLGRIVGRSMNLENGPVWDAHLARLGPTRHHLILRFHHLVCDIASAGILVQELADLYEVALGKRPPLTPLKIGYEHFIQTEALRRGSAHAEVERAYWKTQLSQSPPFLNLPEESPRPAEHTTQAGKVEWKIPWNLWQEVTQIAIEEGATPTMVFLATYAATLGALTGDREVVIGSSMAARDEPGLESMVGVLVNWLILVCRASPGLSFRELLRETATTAREAYAHQNVPLEELLTLAPRRATDRSRSPLFQAAFFFVRHPPAIQTGGLTIQYEIDRWKQTHFDIALIVDLRDVEKTVKLQLLHYKEVISTASAESFLGTFQNLLQLFVHDPGSRESASALPDEWKRRSPNRLSVVIAATFTAEPVSESLTHALELSGIRSSLTFAPYNQVFQQLLDSQSPIRQNTDGANALLVRLEDWENPDSHLEELVQALATSTVGLVHPLILVLCPSSPHLEATQRRLTAQLEKMTGVLVVQGNALLEQYQVQRWADPQGDALGKVPFTSEFFGVLGTHLARLINAQRRTAKKVLVLDCDNTLWKGVVGEDGPRGVVLEPERARFQEALVELSRRGTLLCLASKNEHKDVLEVFEQRSEFPLKLEHLTAMQVHWRPKAESLRALARELSVGTDSFIFLDDNPIECAEIEAALPEVTVVQVPEDVTELPTLIQNLWPLDLLAVTAEDRARTEQYQTNAQRNRVEKDSASFEDFLRKLELQITIAPVDETTLPRASQLTQKTNQFNLTTRRRTESELRTAMASGQQAWRVTLRDRFGDYGMVGLILFSDAHGCLEVDTLLLSCRALGRGVEHQMLRALGQHAAKRGLEWVELPFVPTPKNRPALDFLESLGIPALDGTPRRYRLAPDTAAKLETTRPRGTNDVSVQEVTPPTKVAPPSARWMEAVPGKRWVHLALSSHSAAAIQRSLDSVRRSVTSSHHVSPRTSTERALTPIWERVLRLKAVGVADDYLSLGGDSIQAVQISVLAREQGFQVDPLDLVAARTVEGLARLVDERKHAVPAPALGEDVVAAITIRHAALPKDTEDAYPFSHAQELMLDRYDAGSGAYHFQQALDLEDTEGEADLPLLQEAFLALARRQPLMRTTLTRLPDGKQVQTVRRQLDPEVVIQAGRPSDVPALLVEDLRRPFHPQEHCAPLRLTMLRQSRQSFQIIVRCHHAFGDGWGYQHFLNELALLYQRSKKRRTLLGDLPPVANVYKEFVALEQSRDGEASRAFWQGQLKECSIFQPPVRFARPLCPPAPLVRQVPVELHRSLDARARSRKISLKALFLDAYGELLRQTWNLSKPGVALVANGRSALLSDPELKGFGLFWDFVPFIAHGDTQARLGTLEGQSFAALGRWWLNDPIAVSFNFIHFHHASWTGQGSSLRLVGMTELDRFHFPLNLKVSLGAHTGLELTMTYDPTRFTREEVDRWMDNYLTLLA